MKAAGMVEDGNGRWTMRNIEDCSACRSALGVLRVVSNGLQLIS